LGGAKIIWISFTHWIAYGHRWIEKAFGQQALACCIACEVLKIPNAFSYHSILEVHIDPAVNHFFDFAT
jgi:DNA-directed RNA polymerase